MKPALAGCHSRHKAGIVEDIHDGTPDSPPSLHSPPSQPQGRWWGGEELGEGREVVEGDG